MSEEMRIFSGEFELTGEEAATELDTKIKFYANAAWMNLVEACKCLKRMRDTKLYKELGYSSFGDYTKKSLNIEERQAYTYISVLKKQGESFLQLNASLGITKLALLSDIPAPDRQEFVESHDLDGMTVEEVKKLVAENDEKGEQIEMLTDERDIIKEERDDFASDLEEAEKRIEQLEDELEKERNKPTEVAVKEPDAETLKKLREEGKKEAQKAFNAEKKELKAKLESEKEKAVAEAKAKGEKDIEELKKKFASAEDAANEAMKRAEDLQKQLAVSSSPETTKFAFFFEALQNDYAKAIDSIKVIKKENPEIANKYATAILKYQNIISGELKGMGYTNG